MTTIIQPQLTLFRLQLGWLFGKFDRIQMKLANRIADGVDGEKLIKDASVAENQLSKLKIFKSKEGGASDPIAYCCCSIQNLILLAKLLNGRTLSVFSNQLLKPFDSGVDAEPKSKILTIVSEFFEIEPATWKEGVQHWQSLNYVVDVKDLLNALNSFEKNVMSQWGKAPLKETKERWEKDPEQKPRNKNIFYDYWKAEFEKVKRDNGEEPKKGSPISAPTPYKHQDSDLCRAYLQAVYNNNIKVAAPITGNIGIANVYSTLRGHISGTTDANSLGDLLRSTQVGEINEEITKAKTNYAINNPDVLKRFSDQEEQQQPLYFSTKGEQQYHHLGVAFNHVRRLVILGHPASGKTTMLRWLAVILCASYLDPTTARVEVSLSKINPDTNDDESNIFDLGFKRIPIIFNASAFNNWRKTNPEQKHLPADYIGRHIATNNHDRVTHTSEHIDLTELHNWLAQQIKEGNTALLIDGLDEVDDSGERAAILDDIRRYLDDTYLWVLPKISETDTFTSDVPKFTGGNQVVITSRIAGYLPTDLGAGYKRMTIEPMSEFAIERFSRWYFTEMRRTEESNVVFKEGGQTPADKEVELFLSVIGKLRKRGVTDITSNPLHLSVLAALYISAVTPLAEGRAPLPERRTLLYQAFIEALLKQYDESTADVTTHDNILNALSQLAAEKLKISCLRFSDAELRQSLKSGGVDTEQIDLILKLSTHGAGLFTMREPGFFSFFHFTFQEYLAGRWLLSQPKPEVEIRERIDSTRWQLV